MNKAVVLEKTTDMIIFAKQSFLNMKNLPDHFFKSLRIRNYKSIKDITIADCNRINIFIGKPNVGKSNILEALVWLGGGNYYQKHLPFESFKEIVRFNEPNDLSFQKELNKRIEIFVTQKSPFELERVDRVDIEYFLIFIHEKEFGVCELLYGIRDVLNTITPDIVLGNGNLLMTGGILNDEWVLNERSGSFRYEERQEFFSKVKYYRFDRTIDHTDKDKETKNLNYLSPPFGRNLLQILSKNEELKKEVLPYFEEYGYVPDINLGRNELIIEHRTGKYDKVDYAFSTMGDTLRRMIFYKAALMSNRDSILVFDEPEAHAFPTYISSFANHVAVDKNNNQFFISTHSPYIVNHLLDSDYADDVNIYVVYFDVNTKQTQIKLLTEQDLELYTQYGADLFFNIDKFLPTDNLVTA